MGTCDPLPSSIAPHRGGWEPTHWAVEAMEDQSGKVGRPGWPSLGGQEPKPESPQPDTKASD